MTSSAGGNFDVDASVQPAIDRSIKTNAPSSPFSGCRYPAPFCNALRYARFVMPSRDSVSKPNWRQSSASENQSELRVAASVSGRPGVIDAGNSDDDAKKIAELISQGAEFLTNAFTRQKIHLTGFRARLFARITDLDSVAYIERVWGSDHSPLDNY
jgi:hypothetical protein